MAEKPNMVVSRAATVWPIICSHWLRPWRVKSGMLSDSVAKPTMPVSARERLPERAAGQRPAGR